MHRVQGRSELLKGFEAVLGEQVLFQSKFSGTRPMSEVGGAVTWPTFYLLRLVPYKLSVRDTGSEKCSRTSHVKFRGVPSALRPSLSSHQAAKFRSVCFVCRTTT